MGTNTAQRQSTGHEDLEVRALFSIIQLQASSRIPKDESSICVFNERDEMPPALIGLGCAAVGLPCPRHGGQTAQLCARRCDAVPGQVGQRTGWEAVRGNRGQHKPVGVRTSSFRLPEWGIRCSSYQYKALKSSH